MSKVNRHVGSSLDDFLQEEGLLEEARAVAIKEAVAFQIQKAMDTGKISKVEMARRMRTSRAALDRFLAPGNASVTLQTLRARSQLISSWFNTAACRGEYRLLTGREQAAGVGLFICFSSLKPRA